MAEGLGFEPRLTGPEPVVLPLDDPSVVYKADNYNIYFKASSKFWIWAIVKNQMVLMVRIVLIADKRPMEEGKPFRSKGDDKKALR